MRLIIEVDDRDVSALCNVLRGGQEVEPGVCNMLKGVAVQVEEQVVRKRNMREDYQLAGTDIEHLRKKMGWSRARLAELSGVNPGTLWRIESGMNKSVKPSTMCAIKKVLEAGLR